MEGVATKILGRATLNLFDLILLASPTQYKYKEKVAWIPQQREPVTADPDTFCGFSFTEMSKCTKRPFST